MSRFILILIFIGHTSMVLAKPIDQATSYYFIGLRAERKQEYKQAIKSYSKALHLVPKSSFFYLKRAKLYARLKQHTRALKDFTRAVELDANHSKPYLTRIEYFKSIGNYKGVVKDYTNLIQRIPEKYANSDTYYQRCLAHEKLKKFKRALSDCEQALRIITYDWMDGDDEYNLYHQKIRLLNSKIK